MTKTEYYYKWNFFELLNLLHQAEKLLENKGKEYLNEEFNTVGEFREALIDEIDWIEKNNKTDLTQVYMWFLPTSIWDDAIGEEGLDIGNRIFEISSIWKEGNTIDLDSS